MTQVIKRDDKSELTSGWILVKNQLPKRNENVLVKRKKPFHLYCLTGFQRDGVFYSNETTKVLEGVIAWMPLPDSTMKTEN